MEDSEIWIPSVCPYCGVGCGVEVGVVDAKVVAVRGMADHPVNRGKLCALGHRLAEVLDTEDRLRYPMVRQQGGLRRVDWDTAIGTVADGVRKAIDQHGPDAFAMYISASEYLEEYYIYNKFVKGCLGTNNLDSSARLCWSSGVAGLTKAFGADAPPCAYDDVEASDLLVVSGYNPSASKPVFFRRLIEAQRSGRARMIVIDPRVTRTAERADLHLQIEPSTDVMLHNALAHVLIADGFVDEATARDTTQNYEELKQHVLPFTPQRAASVTGLGVEEIVTAARMIGEADAALFLWGQGLNQSRIGTRKATTLLNLAFITGNVGRVGAGPLAVTGQSGAMALREVGALPHLLPGFRSVASEPCRDEVARIWGVDRQAISATPGLTIPRMLDAVDQGETKVLWIIHANPAATFPDTRWTRSVLDKADLVIVQDCYHPTETTGYGHVLLPAAQWSEKAGTSTNSERRLNLIEKAVDPPGEARPDLEIVIEVARALGYGDSFEYADTEAIFEEYKRCATGRPCDITGVSYARLRSDKGLQWPVPEVEHEGTRRRFTDGNYPEGKLMLGLHEHRPPAEVPDDEYPLLLLTGVVQAQFHSRTRTGKVESLHRAASEPFVEIHSQDAQRFGVADGETAILSSRRGAIELPACVTDRQRPGSVFVPYHFGFLAGERSAVNVLTNRCFDEFAEQPEYKACAVRIESSRLPPASSR